MQRRRATLAAIALAGLGIAACGSSGGGGTTTSTSSSTSQIGGSVTVWAVWTGAEQKSFQAVLDKFQTDAGVTGNYQSKGDQLPTVLGTAIAGGSPPDVAILPQPGLLKDLAGKNALLPLDAIAGADMDANFASVWKNLGTVNGKLYGVYFKAANKSTVWYNVKTFKAAGITSPPKTWAELQTDMATLRNYGTAPFAMCGGSGWTLTDWFENVYRRSAGKDKYDQLSTHAIPWTDASVATAFTHLNEVFGNDANMAGGKAGALATAFPNCVNDVFGATPKAAMVYEGDFVGSTIATAGPSLQAGTDYDFFNFPSIDNSPSAVVGGGDVAVMLKDTPQARALIKFLASPAAGTVWAKLGGFTSPNKNVSTGSYPDAIARKGAQALIDAGNNFSFDMSDLAPAAFGGTEGSGEWGDLQNWLRNPSDVQTVQAALERDAKAAFGH
jgi:ABC-type glycerol-3-phosphate transport system substrate-binding protein